MAAGEEEKPDPTGLWTLRFDGACNANAVFINFNFGISHYSILTFKHVILKYVKYMFLISPKLNWAHFKSCIE